MTTLKTTHHLVAIVGRPNVGKSTLFNRLIKERKSLVHNEPGVTRDRIFARAEHEGTRFYLCDTGGFEPTSKDNIKIQLVEQAELAIEEAKVIIFVVDGREGLHPIDAELVKKLRKAEKDFLVVVNKCDMPKDDVLSEEFRKLGVPEVYPVSAEHNRGFETLLNEVVEKLQSHGIVATENTPNDNVKLAIIGRPNVGKSSILNRLVGEKRSIVDDKPGTTRDAVDVSIKYHGRDLTVIDTAGIRRKSRMVDKLEKFSAFRSMSCLEECHVALLVITADEGATDADIRVAGYAFELRKPILIIVNKWDTIENKDSKSAEKFIEKLRIDLHYIPYAPVIFISALENQRVSKLIPEALKLFDIGSTRHSTSKVNQLLRDTLLKHTPPLLKNKSRRVKFFYATQVGVLPPRFVIFCSHPQDLHFSYKRFLENEFRENFKYNDIPISLVFRERTRSEAKGSQNDSPKKQSNRNIDDDIRSYHFDNDFNDQAENIQFYDDESTD